jgi:hypothetical protein
MKIFVFAYDRYDSMTTSLMLEADGIDHYVLCHTVRAAELFAQGGRVNPERLVVTNEPKGLANNRNYALDMMEEGEWALFLVDDFKSVSEVEGYDTEELEEFPITFENQHIYRKRFRNTIRMSDFVKRAAEGAEYCDQHGSKLLGFAGFENPIFRRKKWARNKLADGRAWMVKKTHLRFDTNVQLIDDLCWTALNIKEFGTVIVNQWVLPDCRRYTAGSFGSIEQRMPQKMAEAQYLVDTYPDLIQFKKKAGWPYGSHVALRANVRKLANG